MLLTRRFCPAGPAWPRSGFPLWPVILAIVRFGACIWVSPRYGSGGFLLSDLQVMGLPEPCGRAGSRLRLEFSTVPLVSAE